MNESVKPTTSSGHPAADERITLRMDGRVAGANWHSPEQTPRGDPYCWSGPGERATLNIGVRRDRDMLAIIAYFMPLVEDQMRGLRVQVDGVEVTHSIHADINPKCIVARVPARVIPSGGETELAIVLPHTISPNSLPAGIPDPRKLGLGVHSVSLIPAEPALLVQFPESRFEAFRRRMRLSRQRQTSCVFPLSYFDGLAYLEACPDVANAVIAGSIPSALAHYRRYGYEDGRRFTLAVARPPNEGKVAEIFDGVAYLEMYTDVADAVRSESEPSAFEHFLKYGRRDGRKIPVRFDGRARRGSPLDVVRLDAARETTIGMEALRLKVSDENAVHAGQLRTRLSAVESAIPSLALWSELEAARAEREARERELLGEINVLGTSSANSQRALMAEIELLGKHLADAQQKLAAAERARDLARVEYETLQNKVQEVNAAALDQKQTLLEQIDVIRTNVADTQLRLTEAAQSDELARLQHEALQNRVHREIAAALAQKQALIEQIESLKAGVADAQDRLSAVARKDEIEQVRAEIAKTLAWEKTLVAQVDSIKSELADSQQQLATAARVDQLEQVRKNLAAQTDAVRSIVVKAQEELSAAARSTDLEQLKRDAARELDRVRGEIASASATHEAREQALAAQIDSVRSVAAKVHEEISAAARSTDLEHLKRDATRELERIRGEIAKVLTMREAREQAVLEQIELLRISLDDSQRRLSATARAEDLDRLKRDAAQDLERVRNEIASTSAVESARGQTLLAQIDTLKAEIDAAKSRAELAEVKIVSAERNLTTEARKIAESVQQSSAVLDRLKNEIAEHKDLSDSTDTVIKSELELLKQELTLVQVANVTESGTKTGKGKGSGKSCSQLGQDLWVLQKTGFKKGGYFVDIGATDGVLLSNTYLLEKHYNWKGICVEPDPAAFKNLSKNRKSRNSNACIWSSSGQEFDFILAKEFGAIADVAASDMHVNRRNAYKKTGQTIKVRTTSLNDLLEEAKAPRNIDYISLDTEGSEYEILSTFDFNHRKVALWTIEHNFTDQRARIYELMSAHGYKRREVEWDDWYFL